MPGYDHCQRCGRKLTSPASQELGLGFRCEKAVKREQVRAKEALARAQARDPQLLEEIVTKAYWLPKNVYFDPFIPAPLDAA